MERGKSEQSIVKDEKVMEEKEVLKLEEFVKKLGGVERAKLALDELARLRKTA